MPNTEPNKLLKARVSITGMGIVSAIGTTVEENLQSLLAAKTGVGAIQHLKTYHKDKIKVGEVALTNADMASRLSLPNDHNFTRTALLGSLAALEATANISSEALRDSKTGFISATTVGGMDKTEQYFKTFKKTPEAQKYISSHHAGDSTEKIAAILGIQSFTATISTACSSAANAILLGTRMIEAGKLDRVIVGGVDSLSKFTLNGFKSLLILSDEVCKPFDENRSGLNLGEAAAFLVLENASKTKSETILGYVSGYGNANDAHHQTASSENGEGAYLAMKKALEAASLKTSEIDYINAHGTATKNNDLSESVAIKRIFGNAVPSFSSTKAFTGHTLAAAGAVEAVFSVLSLQKQLVFPNLNFETPIHETGLVPETELISKKIKHILSNSFGFGGNCTSLIFSKE